MKISWQDLMDARAHAQSLQPSRRQNNRIVPTRIQLEQSRTGYPGYL